MLTVDGLHVPLMPLVEVLGKAGTAPPEQMVKEVPKVNVGTTLGLTVMTFDTVSPHEPAEGVNVYVPEVMLFTTAGLQVPVIPLFEVLGRVGGVVPAQKGGILKNAGVNTGSERIRPVFKKVEHPLMSS